MKEKIFLLFIKKNKEIFQNVNLGCILSFRLHDVSINSALLSIKY